MQQSMPVITPCRAFCPVLICPSFYENEGFIYNKRPYALHGTVRGQLIDGSELWSDPFQARGGPGMDTNWPANANM
jgi:hypothetical protein